MVAFSSVLICGIQWTAATKALLIVGVCLILLAVSGLLVMEIIGKRNALPLMTSDNEPRAEEDEQTDEERETPPFAEAAAAFADEDNAEEGILPEQEVLLEEGLVVEDDGETADAGFVIVNGERVKVRYDRSFKARLIQSDDALKSRYNELKNELLCYDLKPRVSWSNESCYSGRTTYAKFAVRGKTLSLYLALEPKEFAESKYSFTDVHDVSKYKGVPMRLKIKSDRAVRWAKELIAAMAEKHGSARSGEFPSRIPRHHFACAPKAHQAVFGERQRVHRGGVGGRRYSRPQTARPRSARISYQTYAFAHFAQNQLQRAQKRAFALWA